METASEVVQAILNTPVSLPNGSTKSVRDVLCDVRGMTYNASQLRTESSDRDAQLHAKLIALTNSASALNLSTDDLIGLVEDAVEAALLAKGVNVTVEIRRSTQE